MISIIRSLNVITIFYFNDLRKSYITYLLLMLHKENFVIIERLTTFYKSHN